MRDQKLEGGQENKQVTEEVSAPADSTRAPGMTFTPLHESRRDYTYYQGIFRGRPMPFAYLDLDLLDQNIRQVVARAERKQVRLASKSLRSVAVLRRIFASNACFQGIMSYSAQEAVSLASQGFTDLLIGYPAWNEQDIGSVARATAAGAQITLMVDSVEHVQRIAAIAS